MTCNGRLQSYLHSLKLTGNKKGGQDRTGKGENAFKGGPLKARSSFLTVTTIMTGGTQLVEGAHLTGGDTRFCRE